MDVLKGQQVARNERQPKGPREHPLRHHQDDESDSHHDWEADKNVPRVQRGNRNQQQNHVLPRRLVEEEDADHSILRHIKISAPIFDGSHDPNAYLDWENAMDQYYDWYPMSEARKVQFAKMKLLSQAKIYWLNNERLLA